MNDVHGHRMGDDYIVKTVEFIKENIGTQAQIIRYGGDEFCFILYNVNIDSNEVAKTIRENLEQIQLKMEPDRKYILSISIGKYDCTSPDLDMKQVFKKADMALYEDKKRER